LGQISFENESNAIRQSTPAIPPGLKPPPGFEGLGLSSFQEPTRDPPSVQSKLITPVVPALPRNYSLQRSDDKTGQPIASAKSESDPPEPKTVEEWPELGSTITKKQQLSAKSKIVAKPVVGAAKQPSGSAILDQKMKATATAPTASIEEKGAEQAKLPVALPKSKSATRVLPVSLAISTSSSIKVDRETNNAVAPPFGTRSESDVRAYNVSRASSVASRPPTPVVGSDSPIRRSAPPKAIKIAGIAKSETPASIASAAAAATTGSKVSSRRPSLTSTAQPGTPLSERIDLSSIPSGTASRADSPLPIVSKKRADKKAKKPQRKEVEEEVVRAFSEKPLEVHAPVLGRKKKTRKLGQVNTTKTASSTPATSSRPTSRPATPLPLESPDASRKGFEAEVPTGDEVPVRPSPKVPQQQSSPKKAKRVDKAANPSLASFLDEIAIQSMTKAVSNNSHLRNLNETRPFSTNMDWANFHSHREKNIYKNGWPLNEKQVATLAAGNAVRVSDDTGRLSSRYLETSGGMKLLHLTTDEEDRVLELEKRLMQVSGQISWSTGRETDGTKPKGSKKAGSDASSLPADCVLLDDNEDHQDPFDFVNRFIFTVDDVHGASIKIPSSTMHSTSQNAPPVASGTVSSVPPTILPLQFKQSPSIGTSFKNSQLPLLSSTAPESTSSTAAAAANAAAAAAAAAAMAIGTTAAYIEDAIGRGDWDKLAGSVPTALGSAVAAGLGAVKAAGGMSNSSGPPPSLINGVAVPSETTGMHGHRLSDVLAEAERSMRKEQVQIEILEKKLNALVRRNKKVLGKQERE
jgi:CCR4-NOT transcription complex subunit 4